MIFTEDHARQMLDRSKWQTRRPTKIGEWPTDVKGFLILPDDNITPIHAVYDRSSRLKWQVGKAYAIQTGRGKKAIGRTPLLEAIRRERLQEISLEDLEAEGMTHRIYIRRVYDFADLWDSLYRKRAYWYQGFRWEDNPDVWVLEFERVGETGEE